MFIIICLLSLLSSFGSAEQCFSISLEPNQKEIHWKTDVTLVCDCKCASCYDDRREEYRFIEVHTQRIDEKASSYLGDADMNESIGTYLIKDVTAEEQNNLRYTCMVSRVGTTSLVNFTVIEPPPIIKDFNTAEGNDSVTSRSVTLKWQTPAFYPPTMSFSIEVQDTVKGESETKTIANSSQIEYTVRDLVPNRKFKFSIKNYNKLGARDSSTPISVITLEDAPESPPQTLTVEGTSDNRLLIRWAPPPADKSHGTITQYETICMLQCDENCTEQPLSEYQNITDKLEWLLEGLAEDSKYSCKSRAYTSAGQGPFSNPTVGRTQRKPIITEPPAPNPPVTSKVKEVKKKNNQIPALVIGVVVAVAVVGIVAVAVFFNRHKVFKSGSHTRLKSEDDIESPMTGGNYDQNLKIHVKDPSIASDDTLGKNTIPKLDSAPHPGYKAPQNTTISSKPPIPNVDFPNHVEQLHANGNVGFNREYTSINPGGGWSCEVGACNKNKNRYYNVKCYDHTRVKLQNYGGGESDFINANFVDVSLDGYNKKKAYIATQGPLPNTCLDFWRMIWDQNTSTIVMVTNLVELARVKCHQYYPDSGSLSFGPVTVTLKESTPLADFTIRTLILEMAGEEPHTVRHFHFTSWPDHGVPPFSNAILSFVRHVKNVKTPENGPVVVHCSAGVGRTGTFMAIDSMLDMSEKENCVDIFGYVTLMRTCRPSMVQTEDQYIFIHDAILEALTCGVTEVRARDLPDHFQWLLDTDSFTNNVRLDDEFERLGYNIRDLSHQMTTAQMDQNASKNRNRMFIPYDQGRVWLFPLPKQPYSNYINASYIDGFRNRKAYIATQSPLTQTMGDYWRMVWELHSLTLVMLNNEDESEPYDAYFPLEGAAEFGNIRVEFVRKDDHRDYRVTILRVFNKEEGLNRTVSHFQYFSWPEDKPPTSCSTLLEMITRISKCQQTCANKYPVITHCDYGMGRTGAFVALCICLDRMKGENVVDVFQTVRTMRSQRPMMVNSTMLYTFIFTCLVEYLQQLDLYANFK